MIEKLNHVKIFSIIIFSIIILIFALLNIAEAVQPQVAAGSCHTVGLKSDGTIVAVGSSIYGELNLTSWNNIVQVAAGVRSTVGLKSNGSVVTVGYNPYGESNVSSWSDVIQVTAGYFSVIGLKSDGRVVAVGNNSYGQLNVSNWSGIIQVTAGYYHTVGLKSDGTVVAMGGNDYGQSNVSSWSDIVQVSAGGEFTVGLKSDGSIVAIGRNDYGQLNVSSWSDIAQVAAGDFHTIGLKSDGTVIAVGNNYYGQLNVSNWSDVVQVDAGGEHTVGLKSDGSVVAAGQNYYGQLNVNSWNDIVQVAAGDLHTVGLKSNGSAVAVGYSSGGLDSESQLNVSNWTEITQVAAGGEHTVGLKSNRSVVAVGRNDYGQLNVSSWSDIVQVAAGGLHTVGLKSNGSAVAVGYNHSGQLNVSSWSEIAQVAAGGGHTVGLRSNGSVVAVGDNVFGQLNVSSWSDIVQVAAGNYHTVGLKSDGTVVAVGYDAPGQLNVGSWSDIIQVDTGNFHTVGLKSDGSVVAVGTNYSEQLNISNWSDIVKVATGGEHTVGFKSNGKVVATGRNDFGQCNTFIWELSEPSLPNQTPIMDSFKITPECTATGNFELFDVKFNCDAHDPDGVISQYTVNFGDGSTQETNGTGIFHHTYIERKEYIVTCTAEDNDGSEVLSEVTEYGENKSHIGAILIPIDSDEDALYDCWEIYGYDHNGDNLVDVNLPAMFADPAKKDVFVEIDYTYDESNGTEDKPKWLALKKIIDSFSAQGINLHIDAGPIFPLYPYSINTWGYLSRSNSIEHPGVPFVKPISANTIDHSIFYELIADNFTIERRRVFHYCIFSHLATLSPGGFVSGYTLQPTGGYFIVSLNEPTVNDQAGTFMHELGHSLGLHHGGPIGKPNSTQNYKPNYLSVMNYFFQFKGITIDDKMYNYDYSSFTLDPLNEEHLNETVGLNGGPALNNYKTMYFCQEAGNFMRKNVPANLPINWDCYIDGNGTDIEADINYHPSETGAQNGQGFSNLISYNDWENIDFMRGGTGGFGDVQLPPPVLLIDEALIEEVTEEDIVNMVFDYEVTIKKSALEPICRGVFQNQNFKLKNTGNKQDTYTITGESNRGWAIFGSFPQEVSLEPEQEFSINVPIHIPSTALPGQYDLITIVAISQSNQKLTDSETIEIIASSEDCSINEGFYNDCDVDGLDLANFVSEFGNTNCYETFEIILDEENASKWFGGDDDEGIPPRNVGVGQSIELLYDSHIESVGFKFTNKFDYYHNPEAVGHEVALILNLRYANGTIIKSVQKNVPETFSGGWIIFDLGYLLQGGRKYIFTCYLKDGEKLKYTSGVYGNTDNILVNSDGYDGKIIDIGGDVEDWSVWSIHPWDFNIRIFGRLGNSCLGDLNYDGFVDLMDLQSFSNHFGIITCQE